MLAFGSHGYGVVETLLLLEEGTAATFDSLSSLDQGVKEVPVEVRSYY
jgi:hypothetical protein